MNFNREESLPYPQPWEFVINKLDNKRNGFFIDIGAYDGLTISNTAYMELDLDWNGICIEPNPVVFSKLEKNRNCICENIGISGDNIELDFLKIEGYSEMLSGFFNFYDEKHLERIDNEIKRFGGAKEIIKIKTKNLNNLISEHNIKFVDYLSIDVEGLEKEIIENINFDNVYIDFISVENNYNDNEIRIFLSEKGYYFLENVCGDDIFRKINK
jgi:FkbM family methyltransferase